MNNYKIRNHSKFNETEMHALYLLEPRPGRPIGNQKIQLLRQKIEPFRDVLLCQSHQSKQGGWMCPHS